MISLMNQIVTRAASGLEGGSIGRKVAIGLAIILHQSSTLLDGIIAGVEPLVQGVAAAILLCVSSPLDGANVNRLKKELSTDD